ncbi:MAG: hypothetical protein MCS20_01575, partial [Candidatus Phytoplasma mali]|nr:hypothetical protein [Candidatus Phytoplasma australiense]MBZ7920086.1 hypothetical protein [Candidatus Karelsulcia muelleri]MCG7202083.1 hypothetical protein [Candidatus Phytoplasma mali]MCZ8632467.1 hypothetical protein [Spiroplasma sp. Tabriz.8]
LEDLSKKWVYMLIIVPQYILLLINPLIYEIVETDSFYFLLFYIYIYIYIYFLEQNQIFNETPLVHMMIASHINK